MRATPEEAARWVEAAALNGSKPAIVNWGQMLLEGRGVARDPEAAFRWFSIAAGTGHADGINMVGRCYELGWGVAPDAAKAAHRYRVAADAGQVRKQAGVIARIPKDEGELLDPGWLILSLDTRQRQTQ